MAESGPWQQLPANLEAKSSYTWQITSLCLDVHAPLAREVPLLMEATLGGSPLHRQILQLLSGVRIGMRRTELSQRLRCSSGSLKRALDDLEKCGYIRKYSSRYERYKPTVYQLVDSFLLFGFKFMGDKPPIASWADFEGTPAYYAWRGNAFEIACVAHLEQLKRAIGIAAVRTEAFSWASSQSTPDAQIDLVLERADGVTDLCEMKFTDTPFVMSAESEADLRRKAEVFRGESGTTNALRTVLVSANGMSANAHSWGVACVVDADGLFAF